LRGVCPLRTRLDLTWPNRAREPVVLEFSAEQHKQPILYIGNHDERSYSAQNIDYDLAFELRHLPRVEVSWYADVKIGEVTCNEVSAATVDVSLTVKPHDITRPITPAGRMANLKMQLNAGSPGRDSVEKELKAFQEYKGLIENKKVRIVIPAGQICRKVG